MKALFIVTAARGRDYQMQFGWGSNHPSQDGRLINTYDVGELIM